MAGLKIVYGMGYLLDVAPHPDYAKNGWIYLHYTDRCSDCNEASRKIKRPVSMNVLVRGRIRDGEWVDQQTIWRTDIENYTAMLDMAAGGRIAFDGKGHVFISIGIKGGSEFAGVQDLSLPYGKIHRVNDDGSIPADNPFVKIPAGWQAPGPTVIAARRAWSSIARPGSSGKPRWASVAATRSTCCYPADYGWPLFSKGVTYEGTPVEYGKQLGIEPDLSKIEQPKVDLTPSPAVSSFVFYDGKAFPKWRQNMLVGTLKATELYRMEVKGDEVVNRMLRRAAGIRDVAVGTDGLVYLLLEHAAGGRIVRLVPAK